MHGKNPRNIGSLSYLEWARPCSCCLWDGDIALAASKPKTETLDGGQTRAEARPLTS